MDVRALRVQNQKEKRDLQRKLNMLDKQYRYTRKLLQQRRASLTSEGRRVVMVKLCEPQATVNIAMRDIQEYSNAEKVCGRVVRTSDGGRGRLQAGDSRVELSRSVSAPAATTQPSGTVRHRGNIQSSVSFVKMKNIATIDKITEKELARQRQQAREESERLKQLQRETLHNRVTSFIEKLKEKGNMEITGEPP
ncbi:unnamed protein product [Ophioblennius macclurei]